LVVAPLEKIRPFKIQKMCNAGSAIERIFFNGLIDI
jgi:hypothetical protein